MEARERARWTSFEDPPEAGTILARPAPGRGRGVETSVRVPILFVHSGLDWIRGSEQCLLDLLRHLDRARFDPVVCCDAASLADAAAELGAAVRRVSWWETGGDAVLPTRASVRAAREVVRAHGIRLIHANAAAPLKALVPVARSERIPLLAHLHIVPEVDERRHSLLHQVSLAVGVSHVAVRGLLEDGFPADRAVVIHNGIDPERLGGGDARALRHQLGIAPDETVFTVLASLIPRKGIDVVLAGMSALGTTRGDCHLLVCGGGPERAALEGRAAALAVASRVPFLGERRDAGAVLRDATDVLVTAARNEAFALNVLEAGLFGVPVIASDIPAHREAIVPGETGLLFPAEDAAALAAAMECLAADRSLRRRLGDGARRRVEGGFLVRHYVTRFHEVYEGLLEQPRSRFGWLRGSRWPRAYNDWLATAIRRRLRRSIRAT